MYRFYSGWIRNSGLSSKFLGGYEMLHEQDRCQSNLGDSSGHLSQDQRGMSTPGFSTPVLVSSGPHSDVVINYE